jgi:signal transduction histidine kinase/ActR/RegA family two-component response regulator
VEPLSVVGLYLLTGWMGLALAIPPGNVTPVWLPGGIALAALLALGRRMAPAVFVGAAALNATFYARSGAGIGETLVASSLIATGSTLQALAGHALVTRFAGGADLLASPRRVLAFALVEVPACAIAATLGLGALVAFGRIDEGLELKTWLTWWMGDYVGVVLVTPVALALRDPGLRVFPTSVLEKVGHAALVLGTTELVFAPLGLGGQLPAAHFLLPALVVVAYRLGPQAASIAALVGYLGAALGTAGGRGPFATSTMPLLATDGLLFALGLPALLVAAAEAERRQAAQALREAHEQLEKRVLARAEDLAQANAELTRRAEERVRLIGQVERAQRVEATARLAGGMAHDFNNFLTVVLSAAELLIRRDEMPPASRELAGTILDAARHAAGLTRQLLVFAGKMPSNPRDTALDALVREHLGLLRPLLPENVALRVELGTERRVHVDATQIGQLLVNLALNARDAMPDGGSLGLTTREVTIAEGDDLADESWVDAPPPPGTYAVLEVADTGTGMREEVRRLAFEPFFTTKTSGTGLGLASVHGIVRQARGSIGLRTGPAGTTFRIFLPSTPPSTEEAPVTPKLASLVPRAHTILLVEDEPALRKLGERLLAHAGHRVLGAGSAEEALEIAARKPFDLLVTDVMMPGRSGTELARDLVRERPDLPVVLVSGYAPDAPEASAGAFLAKPFDPEQLARAIAEARRQVARRRLDAGAPTQPQAEPAARASLSG